MHLPLLEVPLPPVCFGFDLRAADFLLASNGKYVGLGDSHFAPRVSLQGLIAVGWLLLGGDHIALSFLRLRSFLVGLVCHTLSVVASHLT